MNQQSSKQKSSSDQSIRDIERETLEQYSAYEKILIVLYGLRGEESITELCQREDIAENLYYKWSESFMEAGKKGLTGDIVEQPNNTKVSKL